MPQRSEIDPLVDWASPLPDAGSFPSGWLPPSRTTLETYRHGRANGFSAPHDPILYRRMPEMDEDGIASSATGEAVDQMKRVIDLEQQRTGGRVVGLSANQVGIPARLFALAVELKDAADTNRVMTFIANPAIRPLEGSDGRAATKVYPHGCVHSCLDVWAELQGSAGVMLSGWDVTGRTPKYIQGMVLSGLAAAGAEHELRHLDGQSSPDVALLQNAAAPSPLPEDEVLMMRPVELRDHFRQGIENGQLANWPYRVPLSMWEAIKTGRYLGYFLPPAELAI